MSAQSAIVRATLARVGIGMVLGIVLGAVVHQSNSQGSPLYSSLLSQGAFGGTTSQVASSVPDSCCAPGGTCVLASSDLCAQGAAVYAGTTCGGLAGGLGQGCVAKSSSSSSFCVGDDNGDGICDDDPAHVCCDGICQLPDMCSSSSASSVYCCSFDGTGCIAAPGGDASNDACDQNKTGYSSNTCNNACASSASSTSQQWCCQHVLPAGPGNCSRL